jgi:branched-chain amino acid aminotransferase
MNILNLNGVRCRDTNVVSLFNPSFLYGVNCFEGIRAYWNAPLQRLVFLDLDAHLDRLYESIAQIGFPEPVAQAGLKRELLALLAEEPVREDCYIRITVFIGGDGSWRTSEGIHYMISARSLPSMLGRHQPVRLGVSRYRRISSRSMPPQVKAGANYLNSRYALLDATARGFDDALFLTEGGFVSEATGSAIFFIKQGRLHTPSLDCDLLRSITRMRVIRICGSLGIPVCEEQIAAAAIPGFEAAFLAGTMVELRPIGSIDDTRFATDHPVGRAIQQELAARLAADALAKE